jgi:exonuclease SbcC
MRITNVELSSIKSYDDTINEIDFRPGVNAIIGQNGSGKSTVQEAVGFALFDYLDKRVSQGDFVRNNENSGKVRVTFISNRNGKKYTVERDAKGSIYRVIDEADGGKLPLSGKDEILSWLKEHLGIPEETELETLWKSSIGVPR